ncbi:hypothetical protein RKD38_000713 [Streptomyces ambofaciens]
MGGSLPVERCPGTGSPHRRDRRDRRPGTPTGRRRVRRAGRRVREGVRRVEDAPPLTGVAAGATRAGQPGAGRGQRHGTAHRRDARGRRTRGAGRRRLPGHGGAGRAAGTGRHLPVRGHPRRTAGGRLVRRRLRVLLPAPAGPGGADGPRTAPGAAAEARGVPGPGHRAAGRGGRRRHVHGPAGARDQLPRSGADHPGRGVRPGGAGAGGVDVHPGPPGRPAGAAPVPALPAHGGSPGWGNCARGDRAPPVTVGT